MLIIHLILKKFKLKIIPIVMNLLPKAPVLQYIVNVVDIVLWMDGGESISDEKYTQIIDWSIKII